MIKFKPLFLILLAFLTFGELSSHASAILSPPDTSYKSVELESEAELYDSQDLSRLGNSIKASILGAKESILILTFGLSDPDVIEALNQKASEGVQITAIVDKEHLGEIKSKGHESIEVLTRTTGEGHLHHKILMIDNREIWIGSANFSRSAVTDQENLMVQFISNELGQYLQHEAKVFRNQASRSPHGPLLISLSNQNIYFCLLPHDGYPPKKTEKTINDLSKNFLIEKINQATSTIKIAMMLWTNNDLANSTIQAHNRGVKVQVVAPDFQGNLAKLKMAGIDVKINPKIKYIHNKCMWIDDSILVNGSANWSQSSFTRNDESFVVIEPMTEEQVENMKNYWNYLFP